MADNYLDDIAKQIGVELGPDLGCPPALLRLYALLSRVKGADTTAEDVHDAWVAWCITVDPDHRCIRPFGDLNPSTQALDEPYAAAIQRVSTLRCGKCDRYWRLCTCVGAAGTA